jgi:CRP-like cAMP-binding protein
MVERLFAVTVVVFGLVGFSYLVGSITGSLAELRKMKEDAVKQFWNLRRFLKRSQVPMSLRIRIEKYLEHAWTCQKDSTSNGNLPILKLLTEQLRNELNCAMAMPHLEVHPLFEFLCRQTQYAMQRVATKALTRRLLARNEASFHAGEMAQYLSFVVAGRLQYTRTFDDAPDHTEWVEAHEDWITEPSLWTSAWMTLGELVAFTVSEVLDVNAKEFAEAMKRTPQVFDRVCSYAAKFVAYTNRQEKADLSDICQGDIIGFEIREMLRSDDEDMSDDDGEGAPEEGRSNEVSSAITAGIRGAFQKKDARSRSRTRFFGKPSK